MFETTAEEEKRITQSKPTEVLGFRWKWLKTMIHWPGLQTIPPNCKPQHTRQQQKHGQQIPRRSKEIQGGCLRMKRGKGMEAYSFAQRRLLLKSSGFSKFTFIECENLIQLGVSRILKKPMPNSTHHCSAQPRSLLMDCRTSSSQIEGPKHGGELASVGSRVRAPGPWGRWKQTYPRLAAPECQGLPRHHRSKAPGE